MNGVSPPDNRKRPQLRTGAPSDDLSTSRLQVRAGVRITLTVDDLDESGRFVHDLALRRIRALLAEMPPRGHVSVDIGPLVTPDELLMRVLAGTPCASITVEGPDWRLAQSAALMVTDLAAAS